MRILQRVELDKPILMHDKLDIIWDKKGEEKHDDGNKSPKKGKQDVKPDRLNQFQVKTGLEKLKASRSVINK